MTCGIYALKFTGTDKVYIGQSLNIENRYKQHLADLVSNRSNCKMLEARSLYGLPKLEILLDCSAEELDELEDLAIEIWDAVDNGFNIYRTANEAPTYTGHGYGNTKYSREQILAIFNLLVDTDKSFSEISGLTGIPIPTISNIAISRSHLWLRKECPDSYSKLVSKSTSRRYVISNTILSDKLSAKSKGIVYPKLRSPVGDIYSVDNASKFAKENGLAANHLLEVLNGHRKSHKGWKLCQEEHQ
jgi:group I intron endonuclease